MSRFYLCILVPLFLLAVSSISPAEAETFHVGDGKPFQGLEQAMARAVKGDEIVVHPKSDGSPYRQTALLVRTPELTIRAADSEKPVVLDGTGFDYSGRGSVPRAIVQFDPDADHCVLEGFVLINARNGTHNGAGARINGANNVTIRRCKIFGNDMGIMSGGDVSKKNGIGQRIEKCEIYGNGTEKDPGYNHNLYLGGADVTVTDCIIHGSTTGHNVKSRAHRIRLIGNTIYGAANREIDLVDAEGNTDIPDSDALLVGNTIVKDPNCSGNRQVIHFGVDGSARHDGTLWLVDNVIETPFISPIVNLSAGRGVVLISNHVNEKALKRPGVLLKRKRPDMVASGRGNGFPSDMTIHTVEPEKTEPVTLEKVEVEPGEKFVFPERR